MSERMSDLDLVSRVFMIWCMNDGQDNLAMFSPEYESQSFIAKILRKKMEVFNIDVRIPDPLIMIIEICTQCNPGVSQLILKEVMSKRKYTTPSSNIISVNQFALAYGNSFPLMSDPKWNKHFEKTWDAQKDENGANKCDTPEWWMEIVNA